MMRITRFVLALMLCGLFLTVFADVATIEQQLANKDYAVAIKSLDELIEREPQQAYYLFLHARALAESGQTEQAITQYKKLIQQHPKLPEAYNNLAAIYAKQGKLQQAEQLLNQAMQTSEAFTAVYNNLAALNAVKAREAYAKALKIPAGSDTVTIRPLESLQLAQTEVVVQQENQGIKPEKSETNPTLAYKEASDKADIKSKPVAVEQEENADEKTVIALLQAWAKAWSDQDAESYIGFYHADYAPSDMSRAEWMEQRRERLKRPKWIKVQLSNFQLQSKPQQGWRVLLEQSYKTNSYSDLMRKEFILKNDNGQWSIIDERGLGFIKR